MIGVVFVVGPPSSSCTYMEMTSVDDTSAAVSNGCHVSFSVNFSRSERVSDGRARFFQPALKLPYYSMLGSV